MGRKLVTLTLCAFVASVVAGSVAYGGDPTLVGWWKFDDGTGTTARDSSMYRHDGTLVGAAQWVDGQIGRP